MQRGAALRRQLAHPVATAPSNLTLIGTATSALHAAQGQ
jgi:hypothetical protein